MYRNDPTTTGPDTDRAFYGARSEDSALFRVDGMGSPAPAAAGNAESSGYIAVSAYTERAEAAGLEAEAGLGELSAASAMIRPVVADAAPRPAARGLLQGAIAAVSVAVLTGLFGVAYHGMPTPQTTHEVKMAAPVLMEMESGDDAAADEEEELISDADEDEDEDMILDDEETAELTAEAPRKRSKSSKARKRSRAKAKAKPKAKPAPKAEPKPAPKAKKAEELPREMSVECLLNPKSCMDDTPKKSAKPDAPSTPELPSKLSLSQLKAGTAKARNNARNQCADLASSGDKVQVKLSIAGATGKVINTTVLGSAAGSALGKCVASKLAASRFDRTLSPQQGTQVTVRF